MSDAKDRALSWLMENLIVDPRGEQCDWCGAHDYEECHDVAGTTRVGLFRVHSEREDAASTKLRQHLRTLLDV